MDDKPFIIIVPGWSGSQLQARTSRSQNHCCCFPKANTWFTIWLNLLLSLFKQHFFVYHMIMKYDKNKCMMVDRNDIEIRAPEIGPTYTIEYLINSLPNKSAYLKPLVQYLVDKFGYYRNVDIFGSPYDFRKVGDIRYMNEYFDSLKTFIQNKCNVQGRKFLILSHSLGGCLVSHFLKRESQEWKNKHIDSWYSVGGAFGGAVGSLNAVLRGNEFLIPHIISLDKMRQLYSSHPTNYFLFPSKKIFPSTEVFVKGESETYGTSNFKELINKYDNNEIHRILEWIPEIFVSDNPGVRTVCAFGVNLQTLKAIHYEKEIKTSRIRYEYGDGDGTLLKHSLNACLKWDQSNEHEVEILEIDGAEHTKILVHEKLLNHLKKFIRSRTQNN